MKPKRANKLVQINTVCNTSTGRIMGDIQREADRRGFETVSFVGRRRPFKDLNCVKFGNPVSFWIHVVLTTIWDGQGKGSYFATRKLIRYLREEQPDIIHLHNLHGYYLNIPVLFRYLREEFTGKLFWTFHDCWPFTGHCAYFTMAGCEKWKTGCRECPNKKQYPISLFRDGSALNYQEKKEMFTGTGDLTILTPSVWMERLVKESFFRNCKVKTVSNGIDLCTFSYTESRKILSGYQIPEDKKIILGVANVWDRRKGLWDFMQLAEKLPEEYCIVLVGLSAVQLKRMPDNVIGIRRTENPADLAALYSQALVFVNPSLEESFSLVTVEAFACGTPVIVLGNSAVGELVTNENGIVLTKHEPEDYIRAIKEIEKRDYSRERVAACARKYDNRSTAEKIVDMYEAEK